MTSFNEHVVSVGDFSDLNLLNKETKHSHKGDNGKVLVIAGSSLFHSPGLWAAELLAHFADLVFFYSPHHNNRELLMKTKKNFFNGIVVTAQDLDWYIQESDVILMGPGLMRRKNNTDTTPNVSTTIQIEAIEDEGVLTHVLTNYLLSRYPEKKWILDAGALQELELEHCSASMIYTPHKGELNRLFPLGFPDDLKQAPLGTWLIKDNGIDYIKSSAIAEVWKSDGGNEGLTKGGTGDLLAALVAALHIRNPPLLACAAGSYVIKQAADVLYQRVGPYYTTTELLNAIPEVVWSLASKTQG
ncbi:hypothetical protein COU89_02445 [Candidatus Roizmanbacteria bacterium CG10_big_fil_rev_8_21_14_0_10_45_7]|uniref:YjeF C-terminal domain-containing protein n=1 Tax=Candidatus Roizmanbacteria bacterium CG10_big_fil_rev_8_21_14_0_10_45_7 TaxID=1974854 RepID=A0A2M8KUJ5_9BACT|nr:MAG: hypothetical protein COU89_02445 [Candidatus Roizmanbacteria bacterium CG10_big_fil_rev_8_21_14_0_10_45_7]